VREGEDLVVYAEPGGGRRPRGGNYAILRGGNEIARAKTPKGLRKILDPKLTKITIVTEEVREEV
jgi:hypothetical protein